MKWDAEKYDSVKAPQVEAGRELISMAKVNETDEILDIGCGTARLTMELARLASRGSVIGIDPSADMLEKARKVFGGKGNRNVRFLRVSAERMDFAGRFDLAFSNSALQWVKEQRKALELTHRSLTRGGRIAFQLPAKNFCKEFFAYAGNAITALGFERYFENWQQPWYLPEKAEYVSILKETGFKKIDIFYRDYRLVFDSVNSVLDWWTSAGLRPYLEMLPYKEQEYFRYAIAMSYENNRTEKGIEFDFRRLFVLAEK
jgi:trans-aconitate 2-methyltransferase